MSDIISTITNKVSVIYGALPLYTMQNGVTSELGVTTRKTQLGFEDNDHKYRKSVAATLDVALIGPNRRFWLSVLKKFCTEGYQSTLVLLTNYQVLENMVITKVEEKEEFSDGQVIYVTLSFLEIRHGSVYGSALENADTTKTTKTQQVFNSVQAVVNTEVSKLRQVFLGGYTNANTI